MYNLIFLPTLALKTTTIGAFLSGTETIWIILIIAAISILFLSLYITNRLAKKHKRNWYWAIWIGAFLCTIYVVFYMNW